MSPLAPNRDRRFFSRRKKFPADAVYIGRGTPWGNPFVLGRNGDRDEVCNRFEAETLPTLDLTPLIGKKLLCWCHPDRCHGDAILRALAKLEDK